MSSRLLQIVLLWALLVAPLRGGMASTEDLSSAWQRYQLQQASLPPAMRFPHETCFRRAAAAHGLPLTLLLAVARGESDFDPLARSHANAHGLMQILWPDTAHHLGLHRLSQLYDPCTNVEAGARYLVELLGQYDGDLHLALAAYNYGPGRIPGDGREIPRGAAWYSGYIYHHLGYVLGDGHAGSGPLREYAQQGKIELATFAAPYRAASFVDALQGVAPSLRLDWFRMDVGKFRVMLSYDGAAELARARTLLADAGYPLP